jgi:DNA repair exonuclease SbcCD ATPase subunit
MGAGFTEWSMLNVSAERYTIRRIRLINFHNFVDETIEVRQGGHLFLLGDNASGKTTVLDAIHYVLTAGESMEFNSAARLAGSPADGRRVQGVILRYNVDTGPLNPAGGTTYAALEIAGRSGTPTTVAIGMTVTGMDEKVQRWGILRECRLEEIPFLVDELQGRRPATRQEMREFFASGSGYYSNPMAYQREVANRFFGGPEPFRDVCRLLSIGKAYREIAAHTADYHELFRRLLPEPRTEMFEQVIAALRSLDQASADLKAIEAKQAYLSGLHERVERIGAIRSERQCLRWFLHQLAVTDLQERLADVDRQRAERAGLLAQQQDRISEVRREQEQVQKQIDDLRLRDTAGIIRQEKDLAADYERQVRLEADARAALEQAASRLAGASQALAQGRVELGAALGRAFVEISRLTPGLPFATTAITAALDAARRHERPEEGFEQVPVEPFQGQVIEAMRHPESELAVLRHRRQETELRLVSLRARLEALGRQEEARPSVPGFDAAEAALRRAMVSAVPLYRGLEWAPGLPGALRSALEDAVGEAVLATFIVPRHEFETARRIVFAAAPGLRVAAAPEYGDLADWMHAAFDVAHSDAAGLRCLASEMLAHHDPEVFACAEASALRFRSHERRLAGTPARLIGSADRREALRRELAAVQGEVAQADQALLDFARQQADREQLIQHCQGFRRCLDGELGPLTRRAHDLRRDALALSPLERDQAERDGRLADLSQDRLAFEVRLREMRTLISSAGLDQLEQAITRSQRQFEVLRQQENDLHMQVGAVENQLKGIAQRQVAYAQQVEVVSAQRDAEAAAIRSRHPEVPDAADFATGVCATRFPDVPAVQMALTASERDDGIATGQLRVALQDPIYSAQFGFAYDDVLNLLTDRHSATIADVVQAQSLQISEQRDLLNQRTQDLFRRLIVEQLLTFLSRYVRELREMVKRINYLLSERAFGGSHYRFQVQDVERYRRLVEIVEHYNPFQAEQATQEIRLFFEDHKQDILDTEVNAVPDALDYRNWFHYDMRVRAATGDGVLMDRHTKSVGSGGEQAVPNYLLILTIADFLYRGSGIRLQSLLFDEAFYGIDAGRRDQLLGFATDLGLQLIVASPDQDGVRGDIAYSTTLLVVKDEDYDVHLYPYHWENPDAVKQPELLGEYRTEPAALEFGEEL